MSDLNSLAEQLQRLGGSVEAPVAKGMRKTLMRISATAKTLVRVDTGQLRNSITEDVQTGPGEVIGKVGSNLSYAVFNELGTGPRAMENPPPAALKLGARYRVKGWSYKNPKTGEWVHTRGMPAQPFLYPALQQEKDRIVEDIADALGEAIREASYD